jgi:hypothetical protein
MKSKRTTSVCSSSTRTSSRDDTDEVDGRRSSDESDESDDEEKHKNETPVTFEYVYGAASPALHYKLPKSAEPTSVSTTTTITNQPAGKKNTKSTKTTAAPIVNKKHNHHQHQTIQESTVESSSDESTAEVVSINQSLFLKLLNTIREFFYNRNNWSVTQEAIIICGGFMLVAVAVAFIWHLATA